MARKSLLNEAGLAYVLRCERLLLKYKAKIGRKALARRFNMSVSCLCKYINGQTLPLQQSTLHQDAKRDEAQRRASALYFKRNQKRFRGVDTKHVNLPPLYDESYVR